MRFVSEPACLELLPECERRLRLRGYPSGWRRLLPRQLFLGDSWLEAQQSVKSSLQHQALPVLSHFLSPNQHRYQWQPL
jgi:hypothetical protein